MSGRMQVDQATIDELLAQHSAATSGLENATVPYTTGDLGAGEHQILWAAEKVRYLVGAAGTLSASGYGAINETWATMRGADDDAAELFDALDGE
ncbi:MAG: hypothetical protein ACTHW7_14975 [Actinomycetaceae bacterium]